MPDWMKVEKDTPEKPEVLAVSAMLGITPEEVFGRCFKVWRWADSQTVDGHAQRVTPDMLDTISGRPGFADALRQVGWLQVREGSLVIPNFARHMGQPAKARALAAARQSSQRSRKSNAQNVTEALPEKRREEKSKKGDSPLPPLPANLDTPDFRDAWTEWIQYRKERKPKVTPTGAKRTLAMLAEWGPERAAAAIRHTVAKGWQGIVEPNEHGGKPSSRDQQASEIEKFLGQDYDHDQD